MKPPVKLLPSAMLAHLSLPFSCKLRIQFCLYMDVPVGFSHQGDAETYYTSPFKNLKREANAKRKVTKIFKPSIIFPFLWGYDRTV